MRVSAVVMLGPRSIEVRELECPEVPPVGGAVLKVLANGICGSDYDVYAGHVSDRRHTQFPLVPGHEVVGEIHAIDSEAEEKWGVSPGDRVALEGMVTCGQCRACRFGDPSACPSWMGYALTSTDVAPGLWGGMAEFMVLAPGTKVHKVPEGISDSDAGLHNVLSNAIYWASDIGCVTMGQRVLVLGAGQRGLALCAVASEAGARQVIVTGLARDARKLELARSFGATDVIDVEEHDTVEAVLEMTDGEGVDLAIDSVPIATDPIFHALEVLRRRGTLVLAGAKGSRTLDGLMTDKVVRREHRIMGAAGSGSASPRALQMLAANGYPFGELHSHTFGLHDAEKAIQLLGGESPDEEAVHITIVPERLTS